MNILITQHRLIERGGTELYVLDLARSLLELNHRVVVYSPQTGELTDDFLAATIPVVNDLNLTRFQPDVIHGHHGVETLTAMLHFPFTPAIYVLHDWAWAIDKPPLLDRIHRYIAVDATCNDRLVFREGISPERTMILQNAVDLERFFPRSRLPDVPKKALVFSNYVDRESIEPIRTVCESFGIDVNVAGSNAGAFCKKPERMLRQNDLVFAKARCAREALAAGCSVIVSDSQGVGGMVTRDNVAHMSRFNFGRRLLRNESNVDNIQQELEKYDADDASKLTEYAQQHFGLNHLVDRLVMVYEQAILEYESQKTRNVAKEYSQISNYLRHWSIELASQNLVADAATARNMNTKIRRAA